MRARIRKEMETPSSDWNNEWQQVTGPGVVPPRRRAESQAACRCRARPSRRSRKLWNKDPIDTVFDLLIEDEAFTRSAIFIMDEPDVALALQQPWVSICNDSQGTALDGLLGKEHPHPRAYGTFPRILRKYVREEKLLTLEDAIRKFSSLPAQRMRFADRGVLKAGHVGGRRGLRSGDGARRGDLREAQSAIGGHAVRAGERRAGHRGRQDDERAAGESADATELVGLAILLVFHFDRLEGSIVHHRRKGEQEFSLAVRPQIVKCMGDCLERLRLLEDVELRQQDRPVAGYVEDPGADTALVRAFLPDPSSSPRSKVLRHTVPEDTGMA